MLFFTNGRQGVGLKPKQEVDITAFENSMDLLIKKHAVELGFIGGFDENYPKGNSIALKIVDAEFIIGES